jgi:DNA-directed RNA polymerase specialized sigma24 family protein
MTSAGHSGDDARSAEELLLRMRSGDRAAVGEFMHCFGAMVRLRYRRRLSSNTRRLCDSLDIMSTLTRRLDRVVARHALQADTPAQLWALVFRIADGALADGVRVAARSALSGQEDAALSSLSPKLSPAADAVERAELLDRLGRLMLDPTDERILQLWVRGSSHAEIAEQLALSGDAVRKRWQRLREQLREHLTPEGESVR